MKVTKVKYNPENDISYNNFTNYILSTKLLNEYFSDWNLINYTYNNIQFYGDYNKKAVYVLCYDFIGAQYSRPETIFVIFYDEKEWQNVITLLEKSNITGLVFSEDVIKRLLT